MCCFVVVSIRILNPSNSRFILHLNKGICCDPSLQCIIAMLFALLQKLKFYQKLLKRELNSLAIEQLLISYKDLWLAAFLKKNVCISPFCGSTDALFWTSGDICLGFQSQGGFPRLLASSPAWNGSLRFTSGATPDDS